MDGERQISTFFLGAFAHRAWNPPPSSSLAEEERLCSLLLRAPARDSRRSRPVSPDMRVLDRRYDESPRLDGKGMPTPNGTEQGPREAQILEHFYGAGLHAHRE